MKLVGVDYDACPECGGGLPGEVADDLVCQCGSPWAQGPWRGAADWDTIGMLLTIRSSGRCEIRSPACIAGKNGDLSGVPDYKRSLHHRRPRGMGGTRRADVHSLAALVMTCGHGTVGCHWYTEQNREWGRDRGLLVPNIGTGEAVDPASVPLVLPSGRRVLLDPGGPWYRPPADGLAYAV